MDNLTEEFDQAYEGYNEQPGVEYGELGEREEPGGGEWECWTDGEI